MGTKERRMKKIGKQENQQCTHIDKAFEKIPRFDGTNPSYCFDWLEQTEALLNEHQGRVYREELLITPYCETIPTLEPFHNTLMHTNSYTRSQMRPYRHIIPDTHHISTSPTPNWK